MPVPAHIMEFKNKKSDIDITTDIANAEYVLYSWTHISFTDPSNVCSNTCAGGRVSYSWTINFIVQRDIKALKQGFWLLL